MDFNERPFIAIWETTRACALRCVHCRAEAMDSRHPRELSEREALELVDSVRALGAPLMVLTGGDPMRRPDVFDIVRRGASQGLRMTATPSATGEMTAEKVLRLKDAGLSRLAVSLDGDTAEIHDAFRRVPGSFGWTMDILRWAREAALPVQINTTISRHNIARIDELCELVGSQGVVLWSVFFLVPVGRAAMGDQVGGRDFERVFAKMAEASQRFGFDVKSTEAPQYRRFMARRGSGARLGERRLGDGIGRAGQGVGDGKGFVFISHTGDVYPSGFLPVYAGNVRQEPLTEIYRHSPVFRELRDASLLKGKCGACSYNVMCGGSRARAWSATGDYLAADPVCTYVPEGYALSDVEKKYW